MTTIYVILDTLVIDDNSWECHVASILHGYIEACELETKYNVVTYTDLSTVQQLFKTKIIKKNDIFVFPNAWTASTVHIKNWSEQMSIPIKMIGYWSRGCYINNDLDYRPLRDRNWRKVFERASFRCLDKSFFINEYFKEQFRIYVSKNVFPERLHISQFPLEYLSLELDPIRQSFYKQDMIIYPWHSYPELHEQIVYDFIRVLPNMKIIFAQERLPMERNQLMQQIARSKIAFLPYQYPNIGKEIFECFLLKTIPLVPNYEAFKGIVPEQFQYPFEWTQNIFNYCAYAPMLTEKIIELTTHYEEYEPLIQDTCDMLFDKYYSSESLIKEIFGDQQKF